MASSGFPKISYSKCVSDWQSQVPCIKYVQGKFARCTIKAVDFVCDHQVMLQGLRQLKESGVNLLTGYTDQEQKSRVLETIVEMGR